MLAERLGRTDMMGSGDKASAIPPDVASVVKRSSACCSGSPPGDYRISALADATCWCAKVGNNTLAHRLGGFHQVSRKTLSPSGLRPRTTIEYSSHRGNAGSPSDGFRPSSARLSFCREVCAWTEYQHKLLPFAENIGRSSWRRSP